MLRVQRDQRWETPFCFNAGPSAVQHWVEILMFCSSGPEHFAPSGKWGGGGALIWFSAAVLWSKTQTKQHKYILWKLGHRLSLSCALVWGEKQQQQQQKNNSFCWKHLVKVSWVKQGSGVGRDPPLTLSSAAGGPVVRNVFGRAPHSGATALVCKRYVLPARWELIFR